VRTCLRGYQHFAEVHAEDLLQASLSNESIFRDTCETRFSIQGELRGREPRDTDPKQPAFIDSATFLEMALDLDEREQELEESFSHAQKLEGEFREILGIEDESGEGLEMLTPSLGSHRSNLSFMLRRRVLCWLQVLSNYELDGLPVLVTVNGDAVDELIDPLRTEYARAGKEKSISETPILSLPLLDNVPQDVFLSMHREFQSSKAVDAFRRSLQGLLENPLDPLLQDQTRSSGESLAALCTEILHKKGGTVHLSLVHLSDHSLGDLWKRVDSSSYTLHGKAQPLGQKPAVFLRLSRHTVS
jgi:hypothetical protein